MRVAGMEISGMTDDDIRKIFLKYDEDGSGEIELDEFIAPWRSLDEFIVSGRPFEPDAARFASGWPRRHSFTPRIADFSFSRPGSILKLASSSTPWSSGGFGNPSAR